MNIKDVLGKSIRETAQKAIREGVFKEGPLPEVVLEVPPKKEFGDFSSNFAMQSARSLHCNPRLMAQYLQKNLICAYVDRIEIAGPGFINFYLKANWVSELLSTMIAAGRLR